MTQHVEFNRETLSFAERLLGWPVVGAQAVRHYTHIAAMHVGLHRRGLTAATPLADPAHPWGRAAREAGRPLSPQFWGHSMRTWCFGLALAEHDGADADADDLYIGAVLHDLGLFSPLPGRCFTAAGATAAMDTALEVGVPPERAAAVAEAIASHIDIRTPATVLGAYVKAGSLLDVTGTRVWDLHPDSVAAVYQAWPRRGFADQLGDRWKSEARRFPRGRAGFAPVRCTLPWAAHHAPLPKS